VPLLQVLVLLIAAWIVDTVWKMSGWPLLYGGMISVVNLLWLQWKLRRSERRRPLGEIEQNAALSARKITADVYMTAIERFLLVTLLLLLGLVKLDLDPKLIIIGFFTGQFVMLLSTGLLKGEKL
jgi:type VI protein secretion system component VasK